MEVKIKSAKTKFVRYTRMFLKFVASKNKHNCITQTLTTLEHTTAE